MHWRHTVQWSGLLRLTVEGMLPSAGPGVYVGDQLGSATCQAPSPRIPWFCDIWLPPCPTILAAGLTTSSQSVGNEVVHLRIHNQTQVLAGDFSVLSVPIHTTAPV